MAKALSELADEMNSFSELSKEIRALKDVITDSNEELIATFVEGTKRLIKKDQKDISPDIKKLEKTLLESMISLKSSLNEVERGVKSIKLPTNTDFRATGAMLKLPIKELTRAVSNMELDLKTDAKNPLAVRLSDGENFYRALDTVVQQISGGGASSYAFDKQDSSPTKAATVQKTISGKTRDALVVVNPDGSNVGGNVSLTGDNIPATGVSTATSVQVVDGSGNQVTSFGGGTQYTEGDIDASITGTASLVEGAGNALAVLTQPLTDTQLRASDVKITLDGESVPVTNAGITTIAGAVAGTEMQVDIVSAPTLTVNSHAVTNAGTFAVQESGGALTSLQLLDDTVTTTASAITAKGIAMSGTDGTNARVIKTDTSGELQVDVLTMPTVAVTQSGTWDEVGINDSGNSITVDYATTGSGTATGALRVELPTNGTGVIATVGAVTAITNALPAGTNAIGKLAANSGVDIGDVDILSIAAGDNNIGNVDIVSGTITTVSTVTALGAGTTGPMKAEDVAHASGDQGFPDWGVRVDTPNATVAANGDYHYKATDMVGGIRTALYETDFAVLGTNHVKKYYTNAGAVTDGIVWSPAAGKRWYVTDIFINVSAAATVTLEDDKAGGDEAVWKAELAANSGWSHHFGTPLFSGEDAADLIVTTSAGNVYITITGYEI